MAEWCERDRCVMAPLVGIACGPVVLVGCGNSGDTGGSPVRDDVIPAPDVHNLIEQPGSVLGLATERVDQGAGQTISPLAGTMDLAFVAWRRPPPPTKCSELTPRNN